MEVYVLDSLLRRTAVFDVFESMIWTERWQDVGDFELHISSSFDTRSQFANGVRIAINESYRVMTVETVEDTTDADGKAMLKITGKSLEAILDDRVTWQNNLTPLGRGSTAEGHWDITDTPGNVVRQLVYYKTGDQAFNNFDTVTTVPFDKVPYLDFSDSSGTGVAFPVVWPPTFVGVADLFPAGSLAEPADLIAWQQAPDSLLNAVKNLCGLYDLGFRILRNPNGSQLIFNVYTGNDRTTRQTDFPAVVFATNLDNLQNTTEFSSISGSKNVAYVYSEVANKEVLGESVDPEVSGFDRRVIMVDASSVVSSDTAPGDVDNLLIFAGQQALAANRTQSYFDGELNQDSEYKYGVDYQIGDLVELRNVDGVVTYKRVAEQIIVSDNQGDKSYPTLSMDSFVGVTSWLTYGNKTIAWIDFDALPDAWEDM